MAKIKVHELAKEFDKQSKEILAFLNDKGIEAKAAQSSVDDEAAEMVRKAFGKAKAEAAPKEEVKADSEREAAPKSEAAAPKADAEAKPQKKKRNIIFVSNPHNRVHPIREIMTGEWEIIITETMIL